eukprot:gnl/Chilomastix_cuspidata/5872.p2 GENE.gnl/Chilomastix_cuspidata/5872~~gnl/Chilomastix_cuspidata/5872.p2  ORF type:complete len:172 (+),score=26.77 gnl/Chilomastix_cuspidata/5872:277-792(+)
MLARPVTLVAAREAAQAAVVILNMLVAYSLQRDVFARALDLSTLHMGAAGELYALQHTPRYAAPRVYSKRRVKARLLVTTRRAAMRRVGTWARSCAASWVQPPRRVRGEGAHPTAALRVAAPGAAARRERRRRHDPGRTDECINRKAPLTAAGLAAATRPAGRTRNHDDAT